MAAPLWRVEFDRAAVRDLRKLGADAQARVLRYLRERIASSERTRAAGVMRSPATARGYGATVSATTALLPPFEDDRFVVLVVAVGHRREVYR